jgi:hypothetical protein
MNAALCTEWYFVLVGKYIDFHSGVNLFLYRMVRKYKTVLFKNLWGQSSTLTPMVFLL